MNKCKILKRVSSLSPILLPDGSGQNTRVRSSGRKNLAMLPLKKERMELSQLPREALVWRVSLKKHLTEGPILGIRQPVVCRPG